MMSLHLVLGLVTVGVNGIAAVWGIAAIARRRPSARFVSLARLAQAITVTQVVLGILVLTGAEDRLPSGGHLLSAVAAMVALIAAEVISRAAGRRASERDGGHEAAMAADSSASVQVRTPGVSEMLALTSGLLLVSAFAALAVTTGWH